MAKRDVVHSDSNTYGNDFSRDLIEQYKLIRSAIIDLQNDRNTNNRFLIGFMTALLGIEALLVRQLYEPELEEYAYHISVGLIVIPLVGSLICWIWRMWNKSYGIALGIRYGLLKGMEVHLPAQPFTIEGLLRSESDYIPVANLIALIANIFGAVFVAICALSMISLLMVYV